MEEARTLYAGMAAPSADRPATLEDAERVYSASIRTFIAEADRHFNGPEQLEWFRRLDAREQGCLAVVETELRTEDVPRVLLSPALRKVWSTTGEAKRVRDWLEERTAREGVARTPLPYAYSIVGHLSVACRDFPKARLYLERALELFRARGDRGCVAGTLCTLGWEADQVGDHRRQLRYAEEVVRAYRDMGDDALVCVSLVGLAQGCVRTGDHRRGLELTREALGIAQALKDSRLLIHCNQAAAWVLARSGMHEAAAGHSRTVLALAAGAGFTDLLEEGRMMEGVIAEIRGDYAAAARAYARCLPLLEKSNATATFLTRLQLLLSVGVGRPAQQGASGPRILLPRSPAANRVLAQLAGLEARLRRQQPSSASWNGMAQVRTRITSALDAAHRRAALREGASLSLSRAAELALTL